MLVQIAQFLDQLFIAEPMRPGAQDTLGGIERLR